jgi:Tol biopolymer transport system component
MTSFPRAAIAAVLTFIAASGSGRLPIGVALDAFGGAGSITGTNPCAISTLARNATPGLKVYSPDASQYLVNKEDANGIAQIYAAPAGTTTLTCLTCVQREGGPAVNRMKMQPHWHPSGRWIFLAVERDSYAVPPILGDDPNYVEGQLQNGIWTNMWAMSADGQRWFRLTNFTGAPGTADGFSGVAFTPDGTKAVWSQIMDGNILLYWPFGRWELTLAAFDDADGTPRLTGVRNITPAGMHWNEPGNFAPDNESIVLSGSTEKDAQGMDQYVLNIRTGALVNLTNTPAVWDEHGRFSPGGERIAFMSAYPYRDDPTSSQALTIRTEFMLMNRDGSGLTQLTHFFEWGYPEFSPFSGIAANPEWHPAGRSLSLRRLTFPDYDDWTLTFADACGTRRPAPPVNVRVSQ